MVAEISDTANGFVESLQAVLVSEAQVDALSSMPSEHGNGAFPIKQQVQYVPSEHGNGGFPIKQQVQIVPSEHGKGDLSSKQQVQYVPSAHDNSEFPIKQQVQYVPSEHGNGAFLIKQQVLYVPSEHGNGEFPIKQQDISTSFGSEVSSEDEDSEAPRTPRIEHFRLGPFGDVLNRTSSSVSDVSDAGHASDFDDINFSNDPLGEGFYDGRVCAGVFGSWAGLACESKLSNDAPKAPVECSMPHLLNADAASFQPGNISWKSTLFDTGGSKAWSDIDPEKQHDGGIKANCNAPATFPIKQQDYKPSPIKQQDKPKQTMIDCLAQRFKAHDTRVDALFVEVAVFKLQAPTLESIAGLKRVTALLAEEEAARAVLVTELDALGSQ